MGKPWTTVTDGILAADGGAIVAIAEGVYDEDVVLQGKRVSLWGVCPEKVLLQGGSVNVGAVEVLKGAEGTEIHDLAITGGRSGLAVSGSLDLLASRLWIHDTGERGVNAEDTYGPTSLRMEGCLVEGAHNQGLYFTGLDATIEHSVVRAIQPMPGFTTAFAVLVAEYDNVPNGELAPVVIRGSLIEATTGVGVVALGPGPTLESSVIRAIGVEPDGMNGDGVVAQSFGLLRGSASIVSSVIEGNGGWGVAVVGDATVDVRWTSLHGNGNGAELDGYAGGIELNASKAGVAPKATVTASALNANTGLGVLVNGGDLTMTASTIRDTTYKAAEPFVWGISARTNPDSGVRGSASILGCEITGVPVSSVYAIDADVTLESTVVRGPEDLSASSFGVTIGSSAAAEQASLHIVSSEISRVRSAGVAVFDAKIDVSSTAIRDIVSNPKGEFGGGLYVAGGPGLARRASANVTSSLIEDTETAGIAVFLADLKLVGSVVRRTKPEKLDGAFGDGLMLVKFDEGSVSAKVTGCRIEKNDRAGISVFGAALALDSTVLECNPIDLEANDEPSTSVTKTGEVRCGCPAGPECSAQSSSLPAPNAPAPP